MRRPRARVGAGDEAGGRAGHALRGRLVYVFQDLRGRFKSEGTPRCTGCARALQHVDDRRDEMTPGARSTGSSSTCLHDRQGRRWGTSVPREVTLAASASRIQPLRRPCRSIPSSTVGRRTTVATGARSGRLRVRLHLRDGDPQGQVHALSITRHETSTRGAGPGFAAEGAGLAARRAPRDVGTPDGVPSYGSYWREWRPTCGSRRRLGWCRRCTCRGCGTRKTSTVAGRLRRARSLRPKQRTSTSSWPGRGITVSNFADGSRLARSSSTRTPPKRFRDDVSGRSGSS